MKKSRGLLTKTEIVLLNKYLESGKQTEITPIILSVIKKIEGDSFKKINQLLKIVKNLKVKEFNVNEFRKRTASGVIKSGYVTGCTDAALAYIVMARAVDIPTKYVETINEEWLVANMRQIKGHVYSQSFIRESGQWIWVDPMMGKIVKDIQGRVVFKEGLDSWDIGINNFDSLEKVFVEFKKGGIGYGKR